MKTLVVCLDGTNQTKSQQFPTNIARIFDSLGGLAVDADFGSFETMVAGPPSVFGKYLPGVGTQGDEALKVLGNLFGDGIAEPITRGYTFLSRHYDPGDAIVITGFSRGATAARALAGFVAGQGLLNRSSYNPGDKNEAYRYAIAAWYRYRHDQPAMIDAQRVSMINSKMANKVPSLSAADFTPPPPIKAVAVFDTVSSLGLPHLDSNGDAAFDYAICNTALSEKVEWGFHALAADEMRDLFSPTFWAERDKVIQQIFPGCHSDVGGGYPHQGLSDAALSWMWEQLGQVGLACNRDAVKPAFAPDPTDLAQDDGATFPFNLTPRRARQFPESALPSQALRDRKGKPAQMLPTSHPTPYIPKGVYTDGRSLL